LKQRFKGDDRTISECIGEQTAFASVLLAIHSREN
jgi:hypothetical protein